MTTYIRNLYLGCSWMVTSNIETDHYWVDLNVFLSQPLSVMASLVLTKFYKNNHLNYLHKILSFNYY